MKSRGAKSARQSALQRLDYQKGLTAQYPRHRHIVLYNARGDKCFSCLLRPQ